MNYTTGAPLSIESHVIIIFLICALGLFVFALLLFGGIRRQNPCYLIFSYCGLKCYALCCCCLKRKDEVVSDRVRELDDLISADEDNSEFIKLNND